MPASNLLLHLCSVADLVEILVSTMAGSDQIHGYVSTLGQFADFAKEGKSVDEALFNKTCIDAVTLLLSSQVSDQGYADLLHLLCFCPAYISSSTSMKTGVSIWTRIFSEAPESGSLLVAELIDAWQWTRDNRRGLFACQMMPNATLRPLIVPGEPISPPLLDPVEEIVAHRLWLGFFVDHLEVIYKNNFELLLKMIKETMKSTDHFSHHPAAAGTFFTLMFLVLKFCSCEMQKNNQKLGEELHLLERMAFRTALGWFAYEPEWYDSKDKDFAQNEAQSVSMFVQLLDKPSTMENLAHISPFCTCIQPSCLNEGVDSLQRREHYSENGLFVEGQATKNVDLSHKSHPISTELKGNVGQEEQKQLLLMLCHHEANRLHVWAQPATPKKNPVPHSRIASEKWIQYAKVAFSVNPRIALSMCSRFPTISFLRNEVTRLVQLHISELHELPEALPFFITPEVVNGNSGLLQHLSHWAPCSIANALKFLTPPYKGHLKIVEYVIGVLKLYPSEIVKFFMLQLVQALRYDEGKLVEGYLLEAAKGSDIFAHSLMWHLQGSNLHKKNKGDKHKDSPFEDALCGLRQKIIDSFNLEHRDWSHVEQELEFFDKITSISGVLVSIQMEARRDSIRSELEKIEMELKKIESEGINIYLPTATNKLVRGIQLDSGIPLQSATKVPIRVTFNVVDKEGNSHDEKPEACIFKVGDDCRQDVLALQVISLLRDIFEAVGLDLYLFPYGVVPTGAERGIIEVVPNSRSRSQLGKNGNAGLYEIFQEEFGSVGSPGFNAARDKFISSSAGYAVASFLLQIKDRNSGNLLFDNTGRLVHIDFGFLLGTSPAGNMGFERAHFKLSRGMKKLLDPSGVMKSDTWIQFVCLCVKGYLAARRYMNEIISPVQLMADSGLPCFKMRGGANAAVKNLRIRFHPEMTERRAAKFMIRACARAYNHWTTDAYDAMQNLQRSMMR